MSNRHFFFFVSHKVVGSPEPTWQKKQNKIGFTESSETLFMCCTPTSERFPGGNWGRLTQHNFWENNKQAKGNECSQYKSCAAIFSSSLHIAPSIFSQVDLTELWNTKWALIFSCCTFALYSFVNFPFTDFQDNILIMVSLPAAHCYNAYCTLLGGQWTFTNCQIYNFTWSNQHSHILTFALQTWQVYIILGAAQNFQTALRKSVDCPIYF
jgi:hypothetical protein